jgi:hypothetical protein
MVSQDPTISRHLKTMNDFLGDFQLNPDISYEAIAPALMAPSCVS